MTHRSSSSSSFVLYQTQQQECGVLPGGLTAAELQPLTAALQRRDSAVAGSLDAKLLQLAAEAGGAASMARSADAAATTAAGINVHLKDKLDVSRDRVKLAHETSAALTTHSGKASALQKRLTAVKADSGALRQEVATVRKQAKDAWFAAPPVAEQLVGASATAALEQLLAVKLRVEKQTESQRQHLQTVRRLSTERAAVPARSSSLHVLQAAGDKGTVIVLAAHGLLQFKQFKQLTKMYSEMRRMQQRRWKQQNRQLHKARKSAAPPSQFDHVLQWLLGLSVLAAVIKAVRVGRKHVTDHAQQAYEEEHAEEDANVKALEKTLEEKQKRVKIADDDFKREERNRTCLRGIKATVQGLRTLPARRLREQLLREEAEQQQRELEQQQQEQRELEAQEQREEEQRQLLRRTARDVRQAEALAKSCESQYLQSLRSLW
jgi:hypothetical protein